MSRTDPVASMPSQVLPVSDNKAGVFGRAGGAPPSSAWGTRNIRAGGPRPYGGRRVCACRRRFPMAEMCLRLLQALRASCRMTSCPTITGWRPSVIPAKAGIHFLPCRQLDPRFRGGDILRCGSLVTSFNTPSRGNDIGRTPAVSVRSLIVLEVLRRYRDD